MMSFQVYGVLWMLVCALLAWFGAYASVVAIGLAAAWTSRDPKHWRGYFARALVPPTTAILLGAGGLLLSLDDLRTRGKELDLVALPCGAAAALVVVVVCFLTWPRHEARTALLWGPLLLAGTTPAGMFGLLVSNKTSTLLNAAPLSLLAAIPLAYIVYRVARAV